ncbi:AtpZ/AtpI family protein [Mariniflexile maritimum]|jgi:F0F1-type ATP synthase assembly protein I|uniref:AtpZ/AtpI family protein n=1 Tax=Mariniflexile maritimum TaxID=2682493 RepID=UPI0012F6EB3F|nr:AtpZ/AtpI family protein [Mariniflexile maritimum]MCB0448698.1 AtpZ/AtpI family protein [Confluentibacter sp.]HMQ43844.1 AtpZ/AtpI family protein [Mariniflexile sp.]HMR14848.1 AtpZ/AtpI family protein [Mariniflexile sp.]
MDNNKQKKPGKQLKNAVVLTGIAFQMGITIYLFVLLGKWLDSKYADGGKLFLIVGTLLGVAISLYVVLQQLKKFND